MKCKYMKLNKKNIAHVKDDASDNMGYKWKDNNMRFFTNY